MNDFMFKKSTPELFSVLPKGERQLKTFLYGDLDGKRVVNFWMRGVLGFSESAVISFTSRPLFDALFTHGLKGVSSVIFVFSLFRFMKSFFNSVLF